MSQNLRTFLADVASLLEPISEEAPAGEWLRFSELYDEIQKARQEDDATLPQGIYVRDLKRADWPVVEQLCAKALTMYSKDLQIAAWLTEAWIRLYGLEGAREGFRLLNTMVEAYWEYLYPAIDDDLEGRIAPLEWLDEKLLPSLRLVPVTDPEMADLHPFTLADKEKAEKQTPQKKDGAREDDGARFQTSVTMTPTPFFRVLYLTATDVQEAVEELISTLEPLCGKDTPRFQRIRTVIGSIRQFAAHLLEEREEHVPQNPNPGDVLDLASDGPRHQFASRADAYRMLLEAAEYLSRVEPHSPTPYLIRRAVSWGSMSLVELLDELVKDRNDKGFIFELLGVGKT